MAVEWLSRYWYELLFALTDRLRHPSGAVLESFRRGIELHHHLLGGAPSRRLVADGGDNRRAGGVTRPHAWLDPEQIHMPVALNQYADRRLNRELYFWLAAVLAVDADPRGESKLPAGVGHLLRGVRAANLVMERFPGLEPRYRRLCAVELERRRSALPVLGDRSTRVHQLESAIRRALGAATEPDDAWLREALAAAERGVLLSPPARWRSGRVAFLPVPLWGRPPASRRRGLRLRWLKRYTRRRSQGTRNSLAGAPFDPERSPPSPAGTALLGEHCYDEWDGLRRAYRSDWCRVIEHRASPAAADIDDDSATRLLAHRVRRQFESLRLVSGWVRHLDSGEEVDVDAFVEHLADRRVAGTEGARLYRSKRPLSRDLSVAVLIDTSRSTRAWLGEQRVIEVARCSMRVLAEALDAIGDDFALYGFSSDSRHRVRCERVKGFDERYDDEARRRLAGLQPRDYTRMGAAVRHVGAALRRRRFRQRLLLILTDGRPHDPTDRYEGRYAVQDTRCALTELRVSGVQSFGLTVDRDGGAFLSELFGPGHYGVYADPRRLPHLLPRLYARITAAGGA